MIPDPVAKKINTLMKKGGYSYRTLSVSHLHESESDIRSLYNQGTLEEGFFRERLTAFHFHPSLHMEGSKTVLIIAIPQPTVIIRFTWKGREHKVVIPPTYDLLTDDEIKNGLNRILHPRGYRVTTLSVPWKYLAARSGLAEYGRNNIVYIPGKGSFHRLVAFLTDWPCTEDHWDAPRRLERCTKCRACILACPTKAIDEQRFIIHAQWCLTFHNEHLLDFPDYLDPSWHHCLLGCMRCQECCPENKKTIKIVEERERFSEEETSLILQGTLLAELPPATLQKLDRLSLVEDYSLIPRNLGLLL